MRQRYWFLLILGMLNGFFWFGWNFALVFSLWFLSFIFVGMKDWMAVKRAKGGQKLLSNMWVKYALFIIAIILIIFLVVLPLASVLIYFITYRRLPF